MTHELSWWVGLSRDALDAEIAKRADQWKRRAIGSLDTIGERLRETWEPRRAPETLRYDR